jgi:hypothetical protein
MADVAQEAFRTGRHKAAANPISGAKASPAARKTLPAATVFFRWIALFPGSMILFQRVGAL